jgi:transposase
LARWLVACGIKTVALEATGVYWIPPMQVREEYGLEVELVDARQAKNLEPREGGSRRKNRVHFDLRGHRYELTGTDLTSIDGIDAMTAQTVVSESGIDMSRFATEKHYSLWLGLCPNHQITGGKVCRRRTRRVRNRAAQALRVAAQSLHRSKTALGAYFRRMRSRLGPAKAITATAHKLAISRVGDCFAPLATPRAAKQPRE